MGNSISSTLYQSFFEASPALPWTTSLSLEINPYGLRPPEELLSSIYQEYEENLDFFVEMDIKMGRFGPRIHSWTERRCVIVFNLQIHECTGGYDGELYVASDCAWIFDPTIMEESSPSPLSVRCYTTHHPIVFPEVPSNQISVSNMDSCSHSFHDHESAMTPSPALPGTPNYSSVAQLVPSPPSSPHTNCETLITTLPASCQPNATLPSDFQQGLPRSCREMGILFQDLLEDGFGLAPKRGRIINGAFVASCTR
ncbi:uncharacterized protein EI90DRAFT_3290111 [Cantharellus anzutake]|uniref:uncharacterized protein n=1 Tax=Cantharellus anzutake TaxID=1750568 RepID=UPI0019086855|nr:uncharacterized protein EI90DRAFT_3290111 [Cantharellus anzutake]KAF8329371.1 hypothetical protein EI90DRAFT_3290111 [Cantharellus anzutake]